RGRPPAAGAVPRSPRCVRSGLVAEAGSPDRAEMAGDVPPASGPRGGRMSVLPPETARRFLPSVDRLENAMRAARRSLDRGDLEAALRVDDFAIHLMPEYDAAWLLLGHFFLMDGIVPGPVEAYSQSV